MSTRFEFEDRVEWHDDQGQLHRDDGPAIERADGTRSWFVNGQRHRDDGPAFEGEDGTRSWFVNGKCHRDDGPAYEYVDGSSICYLHGREVSPHKVGPWRFLDIEEEMNV